MNKGKTGNIVRADTIKHFDRWSPPSITGNTINPQKSANKKATSTAVKTPVTAQNLEEIRKSAYQEGLKAGKKDGLQIALNEQQKVLDSFNGLVNSCSEQVANFEQSICDQLVEMTISIAKQVVRQELSAKPELIMTIVQESLSQLPETSKKILIKLHPDDALIVKELMNMSQTDEQTWRIREDDKIERGGCILSTETSMINAELDKRIVVVVDNLLGGRALDDSSLGENQSED